MDQDDQRDHAEEAVNRAAMLAEAEEEQAAEIRRMGQEARDTADDAEIGAAFRFVEPYMSASMAQTAAMVEQVQANLERGQAEREARIRLMRVGLTRVMSGRYAPSAGAITDTMWPEGDVVAELADEILRDGYANSRFAKWGH